MKKRIVALLTGIAMILCLIPTAMAEASATDLGSTPVQLDICDGSISIVSGTDTVTYTQGTSVYTSTGGCVVTQSETTGPTSNRIDISADSEDCLEVKLTIASVHIEAEESPMELQSKAGVILTLVGENVLTCSALDAGILVDQGTALTIRGDGSLSATSGRYGAGIGGYAAGAGTIAITGGAVTAISGYYGAGIGGGHCGDGGTVTISGGTVTATGGDNGAGIGGGYQGDGSIINITGGTVTANSLSGAGIGGGHCGDGGDITITGGTVTATSRYGAGIGGGYQGDGGTTTITGGIVTATGGDRGAGIGGGFYRNGGTIIISGGAVAATGGCYGGAGIGGGSDDGNGGTVSIFNAEVTAKGRYCAIGGGRNQNRYGCDSITIGDNVTLELSYTESNGGMYQERIDINTQPLDSASHSGNSALYSVDAYGHSGVTYQWQVKGGSTWTDVEGQTSAIASIPVTEGSAGSAYRCAITNVYGNTVYTDEVQSYILAFTQQPESAETNLNDIAALTVTSSCSNVTYQWQRSYDGINWANVEGKTSPTLVVTTTLSENGAWYRCVITATNGDQLASEPAQITVNTDAVTYSTDYYLEQADGSYALVERVTMEGTAGSTVTAPEKTFEHYTENTARGTHSGLVKDDNSLILSRYYSRVAYTLSFDANGGSDLPAITAKHGTAVELPEPTRYGFTFDGWYMDKNLTEPADITVMPTANTTIYAKWTAIGADRGIEYLINSISLKGEDYQPLEEIPSSFFYAEVSVTNLKSVTTDTLLLVAYDKDGRMLDMWFMYSNPKVGQTVVLGALIDNTAGEIATLKAYMLPMLGGFVPLARSVSIGAEETPVTASGEKGYMFVRYGSYGGQIAEDRWAGRFQVISEDGLQASIVGAVNAGGYYTTEQAAHDAIETEVGLYSYEVVNGYYALYRVDDTAGSHIIDQMVDGSAVVSSFIFPGDASGISGDYLMDEDTQFIIAQYDKTGMITGYNTIRGVNNIPILGGTKYIEYSAHTTSKTMDLVLIMNAVELEDVPIEGYVFVRSASYGGQIADNRWVSNFTVIMQDGTHLTITGATNSDGYWTTQKDAADADFELGLYSYEVINGYFALYKVDNTEDSHVVEGMVDTSMEVDSVILPGDAHFLSGTYQLDSDTVFIVAQYDKTGMITGYDVITGVENISTMRGQMSIEYTADTNDNTIDLVLILGAVPTDPISDKGYVLVRSAAYGNQIADDRWVVKVLAIMSDGTQVVLNGAFNADGYYNSKEEASDADMWLGLYAYEIKDYRFALHRVDNSEDSHIVPNLADAPISDITSIRKGDAAALDSDILLDSNTAFLIANYDKTGMITGYSYIVGVENIPNMSGTMSGDAVWSTTDNTFELVFILGAVIDDSDASDDNVLEDETGYVLVHRSTYGESLADNRWVSSYSVITADGKTATIQGATNSNGYWTTQVAASDADYDLGLYAYEAVNGCYALSKVDSSTMSHIISNLSDSCLYDISYVASGDADALDANILLDENTQFIIADYDSTGAITGYSTIKGIDNIPDLRGSMYIETVWNTQDSTMELVLILNGVRVSSSSGSGGSSGTPVTNEKGYVFVRSAAYGGQVADNRWVSTYTVITADGQATTIKGATNENGYWTTQVAASDADFDLGLYSYEVVNGYYALYKVDTGVKSHIVANTVDYAFVSSVSILAGDADALDGTVMLDDNTLFIIANYDKTGMITGYSVIKGFNNIPDLHGDMYIEVVYSTLDNTFDLVLILGAARATSGGGSGSSGSPVANERGYVFIRRSTYGIALADNRWVSSYTAITSDGQPITIMGATNSNGYWTTQVAASDADFDLGLYAYEVVNGYYALYKVDTTSNSHIVANTIDYATVFSADICCGDADAIDANILLDDNTQFIIANYDKTGAIAGYSVITGFKNIPNLIGYKYIECVWNKNDNTIDFILVLGAFQASPDNTLAQEDVCIYLADTVPVERNDEYDVHAVIANGQAATLKFVPNAVASYDVGFYTIKTVQYKTNYIVEMNSVSTADASWRAEGVLALNSGEYVTLADDCVFYNITGTSVSVVSCADVKSKLDGETCCVAACNDYGHATVIYILDLG